MKLSNEYICRASSVGKIMTEPQTKHPKAIYEDHIESLALKRKSITEAKNKETKTYLKLVDTVSEMEAKTDILKLNSEKIHLSATCISHIHEWLKEQPEFYGRRVEFRSKYCDKGNACENDSIELAADYYGWGMVNKNDVRIVNGYFTGEADVVLPESIEDIKNSWSQKTFPLFSTDIPIDGYGWQLQTYMQLYDKPSAGLIYTLMDAPDNIVHKEATAKMYELGLDDLEADLYDEVKESMTYSNFPLELRIKRFALNRDNNLIGNAERRVDEIRRFIEQL